MSSDPHDIHCLPFLCDAHVIGIKFFSKHIPLIRFKELGSPFLSFMRRYTLTSLHE